MKLLNKKLTVLCALAFAIALPATSQAHNNNSHHDHHQEIRDDINKRVKTKTITLHREDLRQLNQTGKLGLKKAIKNKLGHSAISQNTKLVSVEVSGRATGGMSMVALEVDGLVVDEQRLRRRHCKPRRNDGRRRHGHSGDHCRGQRESSVTLYNNSRNSQGRWQLTSDYDTRVRQVTITIKDRRVQRETKISLGTSKITKVIGRTKVFHANGRRLSSVTLKAKSNSLDIIDVVVNYRDGSYKTLRRLSGYMKKGKSKTVKLPNSKSVSSITVDAISDDVFGSTGRLEVVAGVLGPQPRPKDRGRH